MATKNDNRDGGVAREIRAQPEIREMVKLQRETKRDIRVLERELRSDPKLAARDIEERLDTVKSRADYLDLIARDKISKGTLNSFDDAAVGVEFDALKHVIGRQKDRISELREEAIGSLRRKEKVTSPKEGDKDQTDRALMNELRKIKYSTTRRRALETWEKIRTDPALAKPLGNVLKGERSRRIGGYRLVYTLDGEGRPVFKRFEPRDKVYDV